MMKYPMTVAANIWVISIVFHDVLSYEFGLFYFLEKNSIAMHATYAKYCMCGNITYVKYFEKTM